MAQIKKTHRRPNAVVASRVARNKLSKLEQRVSEDMAAIVKLRAHLETLEPFVIEANLVAAMPSSPAVAKARKGKPAALRGKATKSVVAKSGPKVGAKLGAKGRPVGKVKSVVAKKVKLVKKPSPSAASKPSTPVSTVAPRAESKRPVRVIKPKWQHFLRTFQGQPQRRGKTTEVLKICESQGNPLKAQNANTQIKSYTKSGYLRKVGRGEYQLTDRGVSLLQHNR